MDAYYYKLKEEVERQLYKAKIQAGAPLEGSSSHYCYGLMPIGNLEIILEAMKCKEKHIDK